MAGKRFAMKIALLEESVKKIGDMVFALNQQFLDNERVIQIVGERGAQEWVKLSPDDIRGNYHIDVEAGSMLPKDEIAARKEAVELLQYITPIITPVIGENPDIMLPIIRMVLDTFDLPGTDDILTELQKALGVAKQTQAQTRNAQNAATEAGALGQLGQLEALASEQVTPPETAQGSRADLEAQNAIG